MAVQKGKKNAYYLPLAADMGLAENLIITDEEIKKYGCDMSFVGALCCNNVYDKFIEHFSVLSQQLFAEVMEQSAFK